MGKEKANINIIVIGNADSGKSTMCGHLFYKSERKEDKETIERFHEEAKALGKSFKYAYIVDKLKEERASGMNLDFSFWKFETQNFFVSLTDSPDHRDFIKHFINTGSSQADAAIVVVSSEITAMEIFSKNGKTKQLLLLAYTLGIKQLIIAVNKIDDKSINYNKMRFDECVRETTVYAEKIGYKRETIVSVPISGKIGDNIKERSENTPWYNGPTLYEAIDNLNNNNNNNNNDNNNNDNNRPLRISIKEIYKIKGNETIAVGRVEYGVVSPRIILSFAPSGIFAEVKSVEMSNSRDTVAFSVKNVSAKELRRGMIASDAKNNPSKITKSFIAQIIIFNHPGQIKTGYAPIIYFHSSLIRCKFTELIAKVNRRTGERIENSPKSIMNGDTAIVKMETTKQISLFPNF